MVMLRNWHINTQTQESIEKHHNYSLNVSESFIFLYYRMIMSSLFKTAVLSTLLITTVWSSFAAKLYFEPSQWTFTKNCPFTVSIMLDTEGKNVITSDFLLDFDRSKLWFVSINTVWWAFNSYTNPIERIAAAGTAAGRPVIAFGAMSMPMAPVNGNVKVWSVTLKSQAWVENALLGYYSIPWYAGDDSNVTETVNWVTKDSITEARNALYGFIDGDCPAEQAIMAPQNLEDRASFQNAAPVLVAIDEAALWTRRYMQRYIRLIILVVITGGIYMMSKNSSNKFKKLVK